MKKQFSITLCILIMTAGMTFAQNNENTIQKFKNAFRSEYFQLSGYGQLQYTLNEYPERSISPAKTNSSIDITRAILFATGKLGINNQCGYMIMFDFGPNAQLLELYGEWLHSKAINIRFGQNKTPFTIENPISPSRIETVNFSRSVAAMAGSAGDFNQFEADGRVVVKAGRDAGLQLFGLLFSTNDFYRIEYYAGLFNGTGMNSKDNNNRKDFIGTVYFYPEKSFKLGGSVYLGEYPEYMYVYLPGNSLVNNRWSVGAEYKGDQFYGRAEYIASKEGELKRNAFYGSIVWKCVPDKWEFVGKYDYYNKDTSTKDKAISDITFGVNYYFAYLSRIQLNYIYTDNKSVGTNHALAAQLQLFF